MTKQHSPLPLPLTGAEVSLWRDLQNRLGALTAAQKRIEPVVEEAFATLSSASHVDFDEEATKKQIQIDRVLKQVQQHVEEEESVLTGCLEKLAILVALRESENLNQSGKSKRRRVDATSPAASATGDGTLPSRRSSPASSLAAGTTPTSLMSGGVGGKSLPLPTVTTSIGAQMMMSTTATNSTSPASSISTPRVVTRPPAPSTPREADQIQVTTPTVPTPVIVPWSTHPSQKLAVPKQPPTSSIILGPVSRSVSRSATPVHLPSTSSTIGIVGSGSGAATTGISGLKRNASKVDSRQYILAQLPLQTGRLVAFKKHKKGEGGIEEWIMAKVVKCLAVDKKRKWLDSKYEIQDVDPPEDGQAPASFTTTIRNLIPLPIKDLIETYPPGTPLPANSEVLGLYPDTTSFYRGKIKSGPSGGVKRYKVLFEDDDNNGALSIDMDQVVLVPQP